MKELSSYVEDEVLRKGEAFLGTSNGHETSHFGENFFLVGQPFDKDFICEFL